MKHPDDPELWAGGTLALHARDAPVTLAVSEHEAARMAEAAAGAAILGARLVVLPAAVSAGAVADLITDVRPDVLITHLLADVHPGHRETAEAVLAALPASGRLVGGKGAAITSAWQQVLTWRDMIRMNNQVPVPTGSVTGRATTPLPRPAEVIEKLGLWKRVPPAEQNGTLW